MSRISDAVEAISLGTAVAPTPLTNITGQIKHLSCDTKDVWRFVLRLGSDAALPARTDADTLERVRKRLCQNITQYIFGEFREPLYSLRGRFYEAGDIQGAEAVESILHSMFGD